MLKSKLAESAVDSDSIELKEKSSYKRPTYISFTPISTPGKQSQTYSQRFKPEDHDTSYSRKVEIQEPESNPISETLAKVRKVLSKHNEMNVRNYYP